MPTNTHSRIRRAVAGATSALLLAAGLTVVTSTVAPVAASAAQDPTTCAGGVALTNGGFESPVIPNAAFRLLAENSVPGWKTDDSLNQIEIWSNGFQNRQAAAGRQFAELNANSPSMLYQDVATTPGQTLAWSLKHMGRSGSDTMRVVIGVPGGTLVQSGPNLTDGTAGWGSHTGSYVVPAGQTVTRFGFQAVSSAGGNASVGNFLDDITFGTGPCLITTKSVQNLTRGGTTAEVGDTLRYTVTTRNDGGNPSQQSVSTDQLPAGIDFVPGSLRITSGSGTGALTDAAGDDRGEYASGSRTVQVRLGESGTAAAGGSIGVGVSTSYTFDAKVLVSAADGVIINEAKVGFRDTVGNQDKTSTSNETQTPVNPAADLAVMKTLDTATLVAGEQATFTIVATNNGPQTGTGVTVTDAVPAGLTNVQATTTGGTCTVGATISCALPDLAVGANQVITVTGTVTPSVNAGAALTNTASISGTRTDPNPANNTDTDSGTTSTSADVGIVKTFAPETPVAGENVTYTLEITNDGPSEARDVTVTDPLDPETTFISATPGQGTCAVGDGVLRCDVGTLAPGASTTVQVVVQIAAGATAVVQNTASVSTSTSDPNPENNTSSTSFQPSIIADLAVTKTASAAQTSAGGSIDFTLAARNNGASDAVNAVLVDTLPDGFTVTGVEAPAGVDCTFTGSTVECIWDTFVVGATPDIVVSADVAADAPAGTVTNTASITSPAQDVDTTNNSSSVDVEIVQSADLRIVKSAPATGEPGSAFSYTLTVTNDGPSTARGVTVRDVIPAEFTSPTTPTGGCGIAAGVLDCQLGDLAPGASAVVTLNGVWSATATGTVSNTATTESATPDPNEQNNTSTTEVTLAPSADLQVVKTTTTPSVPLGGTATFEVTVRNNGPSAAAGVVVDEVAGEGLIVTGATASTGTWNEATATWEVGTLLPGAEATLTVTATATVEGQLSNTATGTSSTPDEDPSNNTGTSTVEVTPVADLAITKTISANPAPSNGAVTYTLLVENRGPSTAANVVVTDALPAELQGAVTTTPGCSIAAGTLTCTVPSLANGATLTVTVTGTVDAAASASDLSNTATVTSDTPDPDQENNTSTVVVPISGTPRVELTKTAGAPADSNGSGRIDAGDTVAYTFVIRNTGDVALTSATITDPMLGGTVVCAAFTAPLAPGAEVTCAPVVHTLTQRNLDDGTVHNEASVVAGSARGDATDDAEADVIVPSVNSIVLTKTASTVVDANGDGQAGAGDTIAYTFTVENTGTTVLTNARITDPMLGGDVACAALDGVALAPGQTVTCAPVEYTLTQDDVDGGVVRNTAKVNADAPRGAVEDEASATADIERTAGVALEKQVGEVIDTVADGRVGAGDTVEYSFTVRNTGNTTLTGVEVSDPLLGADVLCTFATIPAGDSADCGPFSYTLTQQDIENESRTNTASVEGDSPIGTVEDESSAEVVLIGTPAIALTKTPRAPVDANSDGMIGAGDTVDYRFTIRNTGTTALSGIVLDDPLLGGAVDCPALEGLSLNPGDQVECGPVPYTLTQKDIDAGTVHNAATVEGTSVAGKATADAEADVTVTGTDRLTLLKSAAAIVDANGSGRTDAGDTIAYTFTVTNTGTTTLTGIAVSDPRLSGSIVCDVTELAPGEATVCQGKPAVLTQAEVDAGKIVNTASVTGTGTGDNPPTAEDTVVTPIEAQPAVALAKTGGDYADANSNGKVDAGDTVRFRFTVTNTGAVTLTGIAIDDPKLGGAVACDIPALAPGAKAECGPVTYRLTAADIAAGKVVNVATVSGKAGETVVTGAATATIDLSVLATTGGVITGVGWALALLAVGLLVMLIARTRRRAAEA